MNAKVNTYNVVMGFFAVATFCVLPLGGCSEKTTGPTILQERSQSYVSDLPVPANFEQDRRLSDHTIAPGTRTIKHVYKGSSSPLAVRNFYIHHMPASGWELGDEKLQNSVYLLNFRKGTERCEIRVERTPAGIFGAKTLIRATINE